MRGAVASAPPRPPSLPVEFTSESGHAPAFLPGYGEMVGERVEECGSARKSNSTADPWFVDRAQGLARVGIASIENRIKRSHIYTIAGPLMRTCG
jgi:hypothetical protein